MFPSSYWSQILGFSEARPRADIVRAETLQARLWATVIYLGPTFPLGLASPTLGLSVNGFFGSPGRIT